MSPSSLELNMRAAYAEDAPALTALINRAFQVERFFLVEDRVDIQYVQESLDRGTFLLLDSEAGLQGAVYCEIGGSLPPQTGRIGMLSVDPAWQGKGLGRKLVEAAENFFRKRGCVFAELRIVDQRSELSPFYRKLGYEESGSEPFPEAIRVRLPCRLLRMSREL